MVSPFEIVARRLGELGVYDFLLPWLITSAIVWGLLQKSKIFGENAVVINSVISLSISFFIWGFIIFTGSTTVGSSLSIFFMNMVLVGVAFAFILVIGAMFFPDYTQKLKDAIPTETLFWIVVVIGLVLAVVAGLINVGGTIYNVIHSISKVPGGDAGLVIVSIIILLLILLILGGMGGG